MPKNRKISVSFVSELVPTNSNDPSQYNDGSGGSGGGGPNGVETEGTTVQGRHDDSVVKVVQQKLLRVHVTEVILSLILVVLSAVAIIEERILFSLGFCLISASAVILAGVIGLQQANPRVTLLVNILVLGLLVPAFYFTYVSLEYNYHHQQLLQMQTSSLSGTNSEQVQSGRTTTTNTATAVATAVASGMNNTSISSEISLIDEEHVPYTTMTAIQVTTSITRVQESIVDSHADAAQILRNYLNTNGRPRASGTIWALGWLQLMLLIPITICIFYKIHLLRFLYYTYYTNL